MFIDRLFSAASCLMFILFVVKYDQPEEISIEQMMTGVEDPDMVRRVFYNETYKKAVNTWLPFLNKRGYLDSLIPQENIVESQKVEENGL